MTILPTHTQSRIRNLGKSALYRIAADEGCEYADVIELLSTTSMPSVSGAPAPFMRLKSTTKPDIVTPISTPPQPEAPSHATAADTPASQAAGERTDGGSTIAPHAGDPPSVEPSPEPQPVMAVQADAASSRDITAPVESAAAEISTPIQPGTANEIHERASTDDEASPEAGPQAEASPGREQVAGTLADREARHEGQGATATLPAQFQKELPSPAYDRVVAAFEANPSGSIAEIAKAAGCSYSTASSWVKQLRARLASRTTNALKAKADGSEDQVDVEDRKRFDDRLTALHRAEPTLTRPDLAKRLGSTNSRVSYRVQKLGLDVPHSLRGDTPPKAEPSSPPPKPTPQTPVAPPPVRTSGTLTERVKLMHRQHPSWTARMIANELGAPVNSVQTLLATARKEAAPLAEPVQFSGRREMINHYSEVAKRLGKPS